MISQRRVVLASVAVGVNGAVGVGDGGAWL